MLLKTRWVIAVATLASALLFTIHVYPARPVSNKATAAAAPREPTDNCDPRKNKQIETLLPCAWDEARRQMSERYSSRSERLARLERPSIHFRKGEWYDKHLHEYVVGDTDLHDDPPIQVGLTGDSVFDYETIVHEFKHYIVDRLGLGERAHAWIDSGDDQIPGSSIHSKKAR